MSMVERVARAIDPEVWDLANRERLGLLWPERRGAAKKMARAAIEAMPTEAMLQYLETALRAGAMDDGIMQLNGFLPLTECLARWRALAEPTANPQPSAAAGS